MVRSPVFHYNWAMHIFKPVQYTPVQYAPVKYAIVTLLMFSALALSGCDLQTENVTPSPSEAPVTMELTGRLGARKLDEASGLHASRASIGDYFVHNDGGRPRVYVIDQNGFDLGHISIDGAEVNDWEDITSVPVGEGRWLVIGDVGDNSNKRKHITLYFIAEPQPGADGYYSGKQALQHTIKLHYPDGPRDCESIAYDPTAQQILFLTKRNKPPRLYSIALQTALSQASAELEFLGEIASFRRPTPADRAKWGGRAEWISQPTGMDISPDGSEAVVITYRSLYRFQRDAGESWINALNRHGEEVVGPPAKQNEAIAYSVDGKAIYVTSEELPAPVYRFKFKDRP